MEYSVHSPKKKKADKTGYNIKILLIQDVW